MTNYFAILGLNESLVSDLSEIENAWESATRNSHPDLHSDQENSRAAELNQARSVLSSTTERLAHWLALKHGSYEPNRSIDSELMDLFASIQPTLENADSVIKRHREASTALAKALLAKEAVEAQLGVQQQMSRIHSLIGSIESTFPELEQQGDSGSFEKAKRILGQLKFLTKWERECQARLLSLIEC